MKMRPTVVLSYLPKQDKERLCDLIGAETCTPSHAQARHMRKMSEEGILTDSALASIMRESKPNQAEVVRISKDRIAGLLPTGATNSDIEKRIIRALEALLRIEQAKGVR